MRQVGNGTVFVLCGVFLIAAWVVFASANGVRDRLIRLFRSDANSGELVGEESTVPSA
jgi:hypothetical protein